MLVNRDQDQKSSLDSLKWLQIAEMHSTNKLYSGTERGPITGEMVQNEKEYGNMSGSQSFG